MTMRITVINGNTFERMTQGIHQLAQAACAPGTEVVTLQPRSGPISLECYTDEYLAVPGILEQIQMHQDCSDAFVIACWGDPGLEAARESTCKPVIGIGEASMYVANMLAARWGVLSTLDRSLDILEKTVYRTGFSHRCVSIRTTNIPVVETETDRESTLQSLTHMGQMMMTNERVEAICLGCAGMGSLGQVLEAKLGIPVIDGVASGVKMAESLVGLGKTTSKALTYSPIDQKKAGVY